MDQRKITESVGIKQVSIPLSHAGCMICGENDSLQLRFTADENGVMANFQADSSLQGYQGALHGGMISTLLDAAMTHCLFYHDVEAMTADLQVRFLKPVPCTELLTLRARLVGQRKHLYELSAELSCNDEVLSQAKAIFMKLKTSWPVKST